MYVSLHSCLFYSTFSSGSSRVSFANRRLSRRNVCPTPKAPTFCTGTSTSARAGLRLGLPCLLVPAATYICKNCRSLGSRSYLWTTLVGPPGRNSYLVDCLINLTIHCTPSPLSLSHPTITIFSSQCHQFQSDSRTF